MKLILLLSLIAILSYTMTFQQLNDCNDNCSFNEFKDRCTFDANMPGKSFPLDVDCALDVQKRNLCLGYEGCLLGVPSNNEVSFICWHCITNSPVKTDIYGKYQSCMKEFCQDQPKSAIL